GGGGFGSREGEGRGGGRSGQEAAAVERHGRTPVRGEATVSQSTPNNRREKGGDFRCNRAPPPLEWDGRRRREQPCLAVDVGRPCSRCCFSRSAACRPSRRSISSGASASCCATASPSTPPSTGRAIPRTSCRRSS